MYNIYNVTVIYFLNKSGLGKEWEWSNDDDDDAPKFSILIHKNGKPMAMTIQGK